MEDNIVEVEVKKETPNKKKFIIYSLYLFNYMEILGAFGLIISSFVYLVTSLNKYTYDGLIATIFNIGLSFAVFNIATKILDQADTELKRLKIEGKLK